MSMHPDLIEALKDPEFNLAVADIVDRTAWPIDQVRAWMLTLGYELISDTLDAECGDREQSPMAKESKVARQTAHKALHSIHCTRWRKKRKERKASERTQ